MQCQRGKWFKWPINCIRIKSEYCGWTWASILFSISVHVHMLSPSTPSHAPTHKSASQQPVAIRYSWACHHSSKCSIIFSPSVLLMPTFTYTADQQRGGRVVLELLSLLRSSWVCVCVHMSWQKTRCMHAYWYACPIITLDALFMMLKLPPENTTFST